MPMLIWPTPKSAPPSEMLKICNQAKIPYNISGFAGSSPVDSNLNKIVIPTPTASLLRCFS